MVPVTTNQNVFPYFTMNFARILHIGISMDFPYFPILFDFSTTKNPWKIQRWREIRLVTRCDVKNSELSSDRWRFASRNLEFSAFFHEKAPMVNDVFFAKKKVGKKPGGKSMFIPLNYAYSGGPLGVFGTGPIRPATSAPVATSARCAQCVWCERSSTWPPLQNIDFSERRVKSWETMTPIPRVYGKL